MPNLHKLSLSHVAVNYRLLKTICKLKTLRSLELDRIEFFQTNTATHDFSKMPPITSLVLKDNVGNDKSIVARVFNVANLQKLSATSCIQVMPLLPHTLALVELYLTSIESTNAFFDALCRLDALTTLEMKYVMVGSGTSPCQLNAPYLPRLRRLTAPPSFAHIAADRLLSSVNLINGIQTDQMKRNARLSSQMLITKIIQGFTQSSAGLESLFIPFELCSIGGLCKGFSGLQNLTIMIGHPNFDFNLHQPNDFGRCGCIKSCINEVATHWSPTPSVLSVKLEMKAVPPHIESDYLYDLVFQRNLINQTVATFPNVQRVQFFDYLEWTRETCGEKWTGYIPFEFHSRISSQLNDNHYIGKDVDGLLRPFCSTL
ncbi:hypothetical protein C0992_006591 [Termitomyces sp. T32_za158]|nr:hypothetical protein C0992_006591 [Termitomyces sp. T32_za158]